MKKTLTINNLDKVTLDIWQGRDEENIDRTVTPEKAVFIYGIGPSGLTDFEYFLVGKKAGDEMIIKPDSKEYRALVSHFACDVKSVFRRSLTDNLLFVKISDISQAENREIVAALSGSSSCGGNCDCGCGH